MQNELRSFKKTERKFLVRNLPDSAANDLPGSLVDATKITQYYKNGLRYRSENNSKFYKMVETAVNGQLGTSTEVVTEITHREFAIEYGGGTQRIRKIRYTYSTEDPQVFVEVDRFLNIDLILAEVELPHIDYQFTFPHNILKEIIGEVTGNSMFQNINLAYQP